MLWTVKALEAPATELIVTQVLLFVEYCHDPLAESEVYAVIAIPASVLAVEPLVTVSVTSLKLPVNRLVTVAPAGEAVSSFTAVSVELPLATGASFTATMVVPRVTAFKGSE